MDGVLRILISFLLTLLGGVMVKLRSEAPLAGFVSRLLVSFSLPVLTWYTVAFSLPGYVALVNVLLTGIIYMFAGFVVLYFIGLRLGWGCERRAAFTLASVVQNTIFLPLPLALIMGRSVEYVVAYSISYNIAVALLVPLVAGKCRAAGFRASFLKYPPLYGLFAGVVTLLLPVHHQPQFAVFVKRLAAEATLLSFYLVGAGIAFFWPPRLSRVGALVLFWRHVVSPLVHAVLAVVLGLSGWGLGVVLLESVMPPATMNIVFARYYRLEEGLIASTIALSTPIGIVEGLVLSLMVM
ncbi:MAG: hypothetical protein DSY37_04780 [Hyperthermus sp.]|nr:MAG: hypothetical protein DSY37_04780 [Hyperthermus sp.]